MDPELTEFSGDFDDRWDYYYDLKAAAAREFRAGRYVAAVEINAAAAGVADDLAADFGKVLL